MQSSGDGLFCKAGDGSLRLRGSDAMTKRSLSPPALQKGLKSVRLANDRELSPETALHPQQGLSSLQTNWNQAARAVHREGSPLPVARCRGSPHNCEERSGIRPWSPQTTIPREAVVQCMSKCRSCYLNVEAALVGEIASLSTALPGVEDQLEHVRDRLEHHQTSYATLLKEDQNLAAAIRHRQHLIKIDSSMPSTSCDIKREDVDEGHSLAAERRQSRHTHGLLKLLHERSWVAWAIGRRRTLIHGDKQLTMILQAQYRDVVQLLRDKIKQMESSTASIATISCTSCTASFRPCNNGKTDDE